MRKQSTDTRSRIFLRIAVRVLLIWLVTIVLSNIVFGVCFKYDEVQDEAIFVCSRGTK